MQNKQDALEFITAAHNRTVWAAAVPVLKQLNKHQIPVIVLKGLGQLEELHGSPGARPTWDVDVLVPGTRAADAVETMSLLGWHPHRAADFAAVQSLIGREGAAARFPWHLVRNDHGLEANIDFHSDDMDPWRDPPLDSGVWARAVKVEQDGVEYFRLGADDRLIYLCWHFMADGLPWPKLVDIVRILERGNELDWKTIDLRAGHTGMRTVVYLVCELARARASSPIVPSWRAEVHPPLRWRRAMISYALGRTHAELRQRDTIVLRTAVYDRLAVLLSAVREVLFPNAAYMAAFGHGVRTSRWDYVMGLLEIYVARLHRR